MTSTTDFTAEIAERTVVVTWPDNDQGGATPPPDGWQDKAWEQPTLHEIDEGSVSGCSVLRWRSDPRSDAELIAVSLALVTGQPAAPAVSSSGRAALLHETAAADALVADARRAVHESLIHLAAPEADRVRALIADLETAVEGRTAIRMTDGPRRVAAEEQPAETRAAPTDEDLLIAVEEALEKNLLPAPGFEVLERTRDAVVAALSPLVAQIRRTSARDALTFPPSEGSEYTPCVCDHIEPEHAPDNGRCHALRCGCSAYRPTPPASLLHSEDTCPGFPERCPNLRPVDPQPPVHLGGIRCGCADAAP